MSACAALKGLQDAQYRAMNQMNQKFYALQRLGQLLEQASDPSSLVPDINKLIPINQLDLQTYEFLRASCPFLNLPSGIDGLAGLVAALNASYDAMIASLKLHPFFRLNKLQDLLNRFSNKLNIDMNLLNGYLRCAGAICDLSTELPENLRANQAIVDNYTTNFVDNTSGVLTDSMNVKKDQVNGMITSIEDLQ